MRFFSAASKRLHGVVLVPALLILANVLQQGAAPPPREAPRIPAAPAATTPSQPAPAEPAPPTPAAVPGQPSGPSAEIDGVLADSVTGAPIQGATVSLPELGRTVRSEAGGRFSFPAVPIRHKAYEVLTTCEGYSPHTAEVKLKAGASKLTLPAIKLKPKGW